MVNKSYYLDNQDDLPPPMDESWWESVLAEDQSYGGAPSGHPGRSSMFIPRWEEAHRDEAIDESMDWEWAIELYEQDQVIQMEVSGFNRGGLLVTSDRLQGFVPISHLVETPCRVEDSEKWLACYVNRVLSLKVIECDQERGRVVFSERAAQSSPGSRNMLLHNLKPGICSTGVVTNITDFGVFVDLGGIEGLVHVSELSWGRVQHPSEVVSLGQQVIVYVIQVDPKRARVALSLKRLHPNPWNNVENRYHPGQITEAVITSIVPFGAFARLEEGMDGLIHISEISSSYDPDGDNMLLEGQRVQVRILHVDASKQRLGLSLRLNSEEGPSQR